MLPTHCFHCFIARQQMAGLALTGREEKRKSCRKKQVTEGGSRMERGEEEKTSYMSRKRHMTKKCNREKLGDTERKTVG